jgi:methylglutaconyl-CoA hydratase
MLFLGGGGVYNYPMATPTPSYQTLKTVLDARGALTIELHRPEVRNAFNETLIEELSRIFAWAAGESAVRVIVFRGQGPVFCAGGDLNWMKRSTTLTLAENHADTLRLTKMFEQLNECPKPVVGVIHGAAIGGGVGLVSICDYVVAEAATQFSLSEVRLGIVPACIGPFVVAKIGATHARSLFISAERFLAPKAYDIGLVHEVASGDAALAAAAERVVSNMVQCGPHAMATAKKLVLDLSWNERRARIKDPIAHVSQVLAEIRITPEGAEGVRAFLEKRKPSWIVK